jgi:hypothetical protein
MGIDKRNAAVERTVHSLNFSNHHLYIHVSPDIQVHIPTLHRVFSNMRPSPVRTYTYDVNLRAVDIFPNASMFIVRCSVELFTCCI